MSRNDDWFLQFLNQFKPWIGRSNSDYIGKALDMIAGGQAGKNEWKYNTSSVPFIGDFYKWQDANNFWSDYFANRGLDWSKVQYPTMMMGSGSASNAINHGVDTVLSKSKTMSRLYEGLKEDYGDWTPSKQPQPFQPSYIGIRKINGKGQFYRWDYRCCLKRGVLGGCIPPLTPKGVRHPIVLRKGAVRTYPVQVPSVV